MNLIAGEFQLLDLSKINVVLGKNGCGKSFLLKQIEQSRLNAQDGGRARYISPERGGLLQYEPNIDQNIGNSPNWLKDTRRQNQAGNFRQQSASLFRRLELLVLREIEKDRSAPAFEGTIEKLNGLLDRVCLERENVKPFRIVVIETGAEASPSDISSGESELISLGIEILSFVKESEAGQNNILLMDEPDVHLHPDLQDRLARFLVGAVKDSPITLVVSTHSTPLLAGLAIDPDCRVAFKRSGLSALTFKPVTEVEKAILPIFGAHPLSNVFNQSPVLIVEGEDDERVWQSAMRSSNGKLRFFPCVAGSIDVFFDFETEVNNLIDAVYDNARAFSLRDRDEELEAIDDIGHVTRMRLACRAAENLMLAEDCLNRAGTTWTDFQGVTATWADANEDHKYHKEVRAFIDGGFDRLNWDLKDIRNILVGLMTNKPWEVLVGQSIAQLALVGSEAAEGSLRAFLGEKVSTELLKLA